MPLDTGAVTHELVLSAGVDMGDGPDGRDSVFETAPSLGAALRQARQKLGRSLDQLANATRIKRNYLEAIEEMRLEELPSRPFTIGYVRSYARALGLDGEAAVRRFKQDAPTDEEPLRAPVGVHKHADARLALLFGGGAVVITAVVLWNVVRHAMIDQAPKPSAVAEASAPAAPSNSTSTTLAISGARPAPQESTLPTPYVTPGLSPTPEDLSGDPTKKPQAIKPVIDPAAPQTFTSKGQIYGAPANASPLVLQAKKPVLLVVRAASGSVYFAQQLKAGEAYRAPTFGDVSLEVSDASSIWVYLRGKIRPGLPALVTPANALITPEEAPPASAPAAPGAAPTAAPAAAKPIGPVPAAPMNTAAPAKAGAAPAASAPKPAATAQKPASAAQKPATATAAAPKAPPAN